MRARIYGRTSRRSPALSGAAAFSLALFLLCSCGVKGPPKPPIVPAPDAPGNLTARTREGCVELSWTAPKPDLPEKTSAARYEILKADEPEEGESPAYRVVDIIGETEYRDCSVQLFDHVRYSVRGVSDGDRRGEPSAPAKVQNLDPPPGPSVLVARGGDGHADLAWEFPPGVPADSPVNLYRSNKPGVFPWRPINSEPITDNSFSDGPLKNGERYYYQVRPVIVSAKAAPVEGEAPPVAEVVPNDRVPPDPVRGFTAIWSGAGVKMKWMRSPEPDVKGYIVYRRLRGLGEYGALFAEPIVETEYLDKSARRGTEYEYMVRAMDNTYPANMSGPSDVQVVYVEP